MELLPTYPDRDGNPLALDLSIDGKPHPLRIQRETGDAAWKQAVLDNRIVVPVGAVEGGRHRVTLKAVSGGVIVDRLVFSPVD